MNDSLIPTSKYGFPEAPDLLNLMRGAALRLCLLEFTPPPPPDPEKHSPGSGVDALFDALTVQILKNVYVIGSPPTASERAAWFECAKTYHSQASGGVQTSTWANGVLRGERFPSTSRREDRFPATPSMGWRHGNHVICKAAS